MEIEENLLPLKNRKYKRISSFNIFSVFCIITIVFELFCSVLIYYFSYRSYHNYLQSQLKTEVNRIENTLQALFDETHKMMMYLGKQIALYSEHDPHFIEKILVNSSEFASKMKDIYPWSLFDWVDSNGFRVFNSQIGHLKEPLMKVQDSYVWKCPQSPWTLQLSHPTIGNTSGMWVIPSGLGVLDKKNNYLGTLNVGLNIAELNAKIQQTLASKLVSFVILDNERRIILQSADNSIDPKSSYYRDLLSEKNSLKEERDALSPPLSYKDIKYVSYKRMKDYPYIILIGFNTHLAQQEFWALLLPRLLELYGVGCFCLCLLYLLRKKIFTLKESSGKSKQTFLERINSELKESIEIILTYSSVLVKNVKKETGVIITKERQMEFLEKIYAEALNLHHMAGNTLSPDYVSVNTIIEESITILIEKALKKNINIKASIDPTLCPFYGDEFRLKQIIVGLISLSMEFSPKDSTIKISATNKLSYDQKMLLIIKIEDNGFSLNAEDIRRISEKFPPREGKEEALELTLNFLNIENHIRLFNGNFFICNTSQRGKIINVTLPYTQEEEEEAPTPQNVFWLFEKHKPPSANTY